MAKGKDAQHGPASSPAQEAPRADERASGTALRWREDGPVLRLDPQLRRVGLLIGYMVVIAGFAAAITLLWPFLRGLLSVLSPFIVALIVAYLFNPIVNFVQLRLRLTRVGGVIAVNLLILMVAAGFIAIVLPILSTQVRAAWTGIESFAEERALPYLYNQLHPEELAAAEAAGEEMAPITFADLFRETDAWLRERGVSPEQLLERLASSEQGRSAATSVATEGAGVIGAVALAVLRAIGSLFGSIMFLVFAGLVSFYLLVDFGNVRGLVEVLVPEKQRARTFDVLAKSDRAVGGFIRGQIISATLVGLLTFIGLTILGLKQYALLIGFVAAIGNLVPYLGPVMGAAPAVIYMLVVKEAPQDKFIWAGLVIALFALIQFIDGFVFQPKIVGQSAQLHPVAVILALALGAQAGLIGMIVAVPVAAIVRVLWKEFFWDAREQAWREAKKREGASPGPAT